MSGKAKYIATTAQTIVSKVTCTLKRIVIGTTANGAITIWDAGTASETSATTKVATIKASVAEQTFEFDSHMTNGLTVKCASASSLVTVVIE